MDSRGGCPYMCSCWSSIALGVAKLSSVCQADGMKKQASDQSFHDRRYQERKRAEAAKKAAPKKVARESGREGGSAGASSGK